MEDQFCTKCGALLGLDEQDVCHCCYIEPASETPRREEKNAQ